MGIIFTRGNAKVRRPEHLKKSIFIIYSPRTVTVEPATCSEIDTDIVLIIQKMQKHLSHPNLEETKFSKLMMKHNVSGLKY